VPRARGQRAAQAGGVHAQQRSGGAQVARRRAGRDRRRLAAARVRERDVAQVQHGGHQRAHGRLLRLRDADQRHRAPRPLRARAHAG